MAVNMNIRKILIILFLPAFLILMISCGKDDPASGSGEEIGPRLAEAWALYDKNPPDYTEAKNEFTRIISEFGNQAEEALYGRGWCYAHLANGPGDMQYDQAVTDFNNALELSPNLVHALSGLAFVYLVQNKYDDAVTEAEKVVSQDSDYSFSHESSITITDIRLMLAQAYYYKGDYNKVVEQLNILKPGINHPADQPDELLKQIQNLRGEV